MGGGGVRRAAMKQPAWRRVGAGGGVGGGVLEALRAQPPEIRGAESLWQPRAACATSARAGASAACHSVAMGLTAKPAA